MATVKKIKKYQNSGAPIKPTPDSTAYFKKQGMMAAKEMSNATSAPGMRIASDKIAAANKNAARQKFKGKPGYDANGFPISKTKVSEKKKGGMVKKAAPKKTMKMGGKMSKKK